MAEAAPLDSISANTSLPIAMTNGDVLQKHFDGSILLEDWLKKSPPEKQYKHENRWKWRYFLLLKLNERHYRKDFPNKKVIDKKGRRANELSQFCLAYWETEKERTKGEKPIRVIPLEDYQVEAHCHPFWEERFPHMILLKTLEKRNYFLCTDSEEKKRLWLDALKQATPDTPIYESPDNRTRCPSETTWTGRTWTGDSGYNSRPQSVCYNNNEDYDEEEIYEEIRWNVSGRSYSDGVNGKKQKAATMNQRLCYSSPNLLAIETGNTEESGDSLYDEYKYLPMKGLVKHEQAKCFDKYALENEKVKSILKRHGTYESADNIPNARTFSSPVKPTTAPTKMPVRPKTVHFDSKTFATHSLPPLPFTQQIHHTAAESAKPQPPPRLPQPLQLLQSIPQPPKPLLPYPLQSPPPSHFTANNNNNNNNNNNVVNDINVYDIPNCEISTIKRISIGNLIVEVPKDGKICYQNDKVIILSSRQEVTFQVRQLEQH